MAPAGAGTRSVLPLSALRRIVGPESHLTDEELLELREQCSELARSALAILLEPKRARTVPRLAIPRACVLRLVPKERLEEFEERAAIREYDGGLPRGEAERAALRDLGIVP